MSSAAKPAPGGVYSAPTAPTVHGGGAHGNSSHGSPGTASVAAAAAVAASKPLYGAQQASGAGVSGAGGPGGMGGMQQAASQQPQQVGGEVRDLLLLLLFYSQGFSNGGLSEVKEKKRIYIFSQVHVWVSVYLSSSGVLRYDGVSFVRERVGGGHRGFW